MNNENDAALATNSKIRATPSSRLNAPAIAPSRSTASRPAPNRPSPESSHHSAAAFTSRTSQSPTASAAANAADIQHRYTTAGSRILLSAIAESSPRTEPPRPSTESSRRDHSATTADQKSNATISANSRFVKKKSDKQDPQLAREGQRMATLPARRWTFPVPRG